MSSYILLSIASILPVIASIVLYFVCKKYDFHNQVVIGIIFGILAIVGTEWGIPMNGAQVNCRDAAVLCAGLFFGAPAGIIAGIIGGVERWIAVAWGIGTFTRVACTVSTILAGFYAAGLRKLLFEDKKPSWAISFAIGVVVEVFHLTMVFVTNMNDTDRAIKVVSACSAPMIIANGVSVMLACALISFAERKTVEELNNARISQVIQRYLLVVVFVAFALTTIFMARFQQSVADRQIENILTISIDDVKNDINEISNNNILTKAQKISALVDKRPIDELAEEYDVAEISIIDKNGIIVKSNIDSYIGFDMNSGEQSREFLCLLEEKSPKTYVQEYGPITSDPNIFRKYGAYKNSEDSFVQIGYDAKDFQNEIASAVKDLTKYRHIGQTGFVAISNKDWIVQSAPRNLERFNAYFTGIRIDPLLIEKDVIYEKVVDEKDSFCMYDETEGYYIIAVYPKDEALKARNVALYVNTFLEIMVFALLFGFIYYLIKKVVGENIRAVNKDLRRIANGDLSVVLDVKSTYEFESLSSDINSTVTTLKRYISEAAARIDAELEFAKSIQSSALPRVFPAFPQYKNFDIYARMDTAKEVGGDFYDFYMTDNNTLNFLIADVSGKGIPAAMFMMRAKTELKSLTENGLQIGEVFTKGNNALCEGNDAGMFVTAWQGSINLDTGHVTFANAGHNPPVVKHVGGQFEYLKSRAGLVLAGMEGIPYRTQEFELRPGDIILLYTDGVTEATDANNELYGEDRLLNLLNSREFSDMKDMCDAVKADADTFVGEAPQFDDMTMVGFKYIGSIPTLKIEKEEVSGNDVSEITEKIEETLTSLDCPMKVIIQMNIAIDEIYSNIVKYAYKGKTGPVELILDEINNPHGITLTFIDSGKPFNPLTNADPDITLSAEERGIGGLGILMVKKSMDDMTYEYKAGKNILKLTKLF